MSLNFIAAYAIGAVIAVTVGNLLAGMPMWTNFLPALIAGLVGGGMVDGALNYFNAEALVASLTGILCAVRGEFVPVSKRASGGIARRFMTVLAIVIAVTVIAMAGGALHLLLSLAPERSKPTKPSSSAPSTRAARSSLRF